MDGGNKGGVPEDAANGPARELFEATGYGVMEGSVVAGSTTEGKVFIALDSAAVAISIDGCAELAAGKDEAAAKANELGMPTHAYASARSLSQFKPPIPVFHL